jgi:hypothetical protein
MSTEMRWLPTFDGPVDFNGLPQVQTWTKDVGEPAPIPAPAIDPRVLNEMQAVQDAIAAQARETAELIRLGKFRPEDANRPAGPRVLATVRDRLVQHTFVEVADEDVAVNEKGEAVSRRTGRVLIPRDQVDKVIADLRQRAENHGRKKPVQP